MEEFDHFWTTLKIMNGHPCLIGAPHPTCIETMILNMNEYFIYTEPYAGIVFNGSHDISYYKTLKIDNDVPWNHTLILLDIFKAGAENLPMYKGFHITDEKEELINSACRKLIKYGLEPNLPKKILFGSQTQNPAELIIKLRTVEEMEHRRQHVFIIAKAIVGIFDILNTRHHEKHDHHSELLKSKVVEWRRNVRGLIDKSIYYDDTELYNKHQSPAANQYTSDNGCGHWTNEKYEVVGIIPLLIKQFTPDVDFKETKCARYGNKLTKKVDDFNYLNDILNIMSDQLYSVILVSLIILFKESADSSNFKEGISERKNWSKLNFSHFANMRKGNYVFSDIVNLSAMEGKANCSLKKELQKVISKVIFLSCDNFNLALQCLMKSKDLKSIAMLPRTKIVSMKLEVILRSYVRNESIDNLIERLYDGLMSECLWEREISAKLINLLLCKKDNLSKLIHSEIIRDNVKMINSIRYKRNSVHIAPAIKVLYEVFKCEEIYDKDAITIELRPIIDILYYLIHLTTHEIYKEKLLSLLINYFKNLSEDQAADHFDSFTGLKFLSEKHRNLTCNLDCMKILEFNVNSNLNNGNNMKTSFKSIIVEYLPISERRDVRISINEMEKYVDIIAIILKNLKKPLKYNRFYLFRLLRENCNILSDSLHWNIKGKSRHTAILCLINNLIDKDNDYKRLTELCKRDSLYIVDCLKEILDELVYIVTEKKVAQNANSMFISVVTVILRMICIVYETNYPISEQASDRANKFVSFVPVLRKLQAHVDSESVKVIKCLIFSLHKFDIPEPKETNIVGKVNVPYLEINKYKEVKIDLTGKVPSEVYVEAIDDILSDSIKRQTSGVRHLVELMRTGKITVDEEASDLCTIIEGVKLLTCFKPLACMEKVLSNMAIYLEAETVEDCKAIEAWIDYLMIMTNMEVFQDTKHKYLFVLIQLTNLEFTIGADKICLLVKVFKALKQFAIYSKWTFSSEEKILMLDKCYLHLHIISHNTVKQNVLAFLVGMLTNDRPGLDMFSEIVRSRTMLIYYRVQEILNEKYLDAELMQYAEFIIDFINKILISFSTVDSSHFHSKLRNFQNKYLDVLDKITFTT